MNLEGVHPDLVEVAKLALELSPIDFMIVDGLRTPKEQEAHLKSGASKTRNSRHLTGHAIDIAAFVGGKISWQYELYEIIAKAFKEAASDLGVPITWGGDWNTFKDAGHFELDWKEYPNE